ncbi:MAG: hypothetical protein EXQ74_02180 [Thermoleophilia bacterium]|nr:hypothetical protein [Thermoleophilia bacterium]
MTRRSHIIAAAVVVIALSGVVAGCGGSALPDGVVAQIAGQTIRTAELDYALAQQKAAADQQTQTFPEPGSEEYTVLQRQSLEGLVFQRIVLLEAKACGTPCTATAAQIAAERAETITTNFSGSAAKLADFLKEQHLTNADVDRILRVGLEQPKVEARVTKGITYSAEEAQTYCAEHPQEFKQPASRAASHILVKTEAEADSIRAQVTSWNFADLASQYSIDPGSKDKGGSLGTISKGALVPEFETVAFALADGEISPPVKTQFGYHIITVTLTAARDTPCSEAEAGIITAQTALKEVKALEVWRTTVTKKYADKTVYADTDLAPTATTAG